MLIKLKLFNLQNAIAETAVKFLQPLPEVRGNRKPRSSSIFGWNQALRFLALPSWLTLNWLP